MIVWLEDPEQWAYLRVSPFMRGSRRGWRKGAKLPMGSFYKLVGYKLDGRMERGSFLYTIFWLKDYDAGCPRGADYYDRGGRPCEGKLVSDILEALEKGEELFWFNREGKTFWRWVRA